MPELLALSFLQPWLWAILERLKGATIGGAFFAIENRDWKPPTKLLGQRFALHASAGYDRDGLSFILRTLEPETSRKGLDMAPRGAIVGTARLLGAVGMAAGRHEDGSTFLGLQVPPLGPVPGPLFEAVGRSPWAFGRWCWLLADVAKLAEPIPCKGHLGLWKVPPELAARVLAREEACHA